MTTDLNKPTWVYVARKTLREFSGDQCTDLVAALTYYAVLALFPTAIALLSLVGIFGQGAKTVDTLLRVVSEAGGSSVAQTLRPTLETLSQTPRAGLALILGLLGALWSASGYVGAFGRAMNRTYGIGEGGQYGNYAASPRRSSTVRSASPARSWAASWPASSSSKSRDQPRPVTSPTLLQRSKASTTSRRSWSQRLSKGPSARWSRPSSTAAAPGHSNAGLVNGPVAEAIRHAKHHAAGMAPLRA